jgi:16S rRNA processing protein RimM
MKQENRKPSEPREDEPLIVVARAVRTRGLKGEIVADLLTDFPDRFDRVSRLFAVSPDGTRQIAQLEGHWFQKGRIILKLTGYDTIESAKSLVGYEFAVPESERVKLAEDEFYDWELEGCSVETVAGQQAGTVKGVMRTGGVDLLVVGDDKQKESLVPMVESILVEVDPGNKTIVIDPPPGLLDL